jgi:hypothetical protein
MRWPPWKGHHEEAVRNQAAAEQALEQAISELPEAKKMAEELRKYSRRNHLAEQFDRAFRARRDGHA